ncbi:hypothetical protein AMECASPLE_039682 [Ameca splendens]|uniref:Uncharacterized protein n=1 Tax=Ameca splendens TaxID=208324 RepID=A0ABV0XXI5_9TELE
MGKGQSKSSDLKGDVKFMENYVKGAEEICNRWHKKYGFSGNLIITEILKLHGDLKLEIMHSKDSRDNKKTLPDYNFKGDLSVPECTQLINRLKQKDELKKQQEQPLTDIAIILRP